MKLLRSLKFWGIVSICLMGILAICLFMIPGGDSKSVSIGAVESQSEAVDTPTESNSEDVYDEDLASGLSSMVDELLKGTSSAVSETAETAGKVVGEVANEVASNIDDTPATNEEDVIVVIEDSNMDDVGAIEIPEQVSSESVPLVTSVNNVVFYGDSWMDNPVFRGRFGSGNILRVKGAKWAQYFVQSGLVTPEDNVQAVFVQFGLNDWQTGETGLNNSSYMKKFLDQLAVAHPNVPLIITRSPHTGSGYVSMTGCNINPRCDKYSQYVKEYCDSHENYYYVDATSCLEDSNGWLKSEYADSSTYHLTNKGYDVWFNKIESVILDVLNR